MSHPQQRQRHPQPWKHPWFYVWYVLYWLALALVMGVVILIFLGDEKTPRWVDLAVTASQVLIAFLGAYALAARRIFLPDALKARGFDVVQPTRPTTKVQ